eukprot:661002-Amphidinium_carterae.1
MNQVVGSRNLDTRRQACDPSETKTALEVALHQLQMEDRYQIFPPEHLRTLSPQMVAGIKTTKERRYEQEQSVAAQNIEWITNNQKYSKNDQNSHFQNDGISRLK